MVARILAVLRVLGLCVTWHWALETGLHRIYTLCRLDGGDVRAISWEGKEKVSVLETPPPRILNPHDAIVRVTLTAICGSDLHIYGG